MPPITDSELLEYLDGAAAPERARQIESDPKLMVRAQSLKRLQNGLRARLHRANCPDPLTLGDYQLGFLHGNAALLIHQHLADCRFCRAELTQLGAFSAPEAPGIVELTRVLIARLISGSLSGQPFGLAPAPGVRGGPSAATYSAGETQILLSMHADARRPERFTLTGLVVNSALEGAPVHLGGGTETWNTQVDDLGNFSFCDLKPGDYELSLQTPGEEIRFPTLSIA